MYSTALIFKPGTNGELHNGQTHVLRPGMSDQVADGAEAHRSSAPGGARLFIVD